MSTVRPRPLRVMVGIKEGSDAEGITMELEAHGMEVRVGSSPEEIHHLSRKGPWDLVVFRASPFDADMFLLAERLQAACPGLTGKILFLPDDSQPAADELVGNLTGVMEFLTTRSPGNAPSSPQAGQENREKRE